MTLAAAIRADLAAVGVIMGQSVTVTIGGVSGSGVRKTSRSTASQLESLGQIAPTDQKVMVDHSAFPACDVGTEIIVDGENVTVTLAVTDHVEATRHISYRVRREP